jgi:hypothetical protein
MVGNPDGVQSWVDLEHFDELNVDVDHAGSDDDHHSGSDDDHHSGAHYDAGADDDHYSGAHYDAGPDDDYHSGPHDDTSADHHPASRRVYDFDDTRLDDLGWRDHRLYLLNGPRCIGERCPGVRSRSSSHLGHIAIHRAVHQPARCPDRGPGSSRLGDGGHLPQGRGKEPG